MIDPVEKAGFTRIECDYKDLNLAMRDEVLLIEMKKFKDDTKASRVAGNHLDERLIDELRNVFRFHSEQPELDGIILTSGHRVVFSRGAKIELLKDASAGECSAFLAKAQELIRLIRNCPIPVYAACNGLTYGGGLELALACDYRIAADRELTLFGFPEGHLGLLPAMGGVANGVELLGRGIIFDMIYNCRLDISALTAKELGLVDKLADDKDLLGETFRYVHATMEKKRHSPVLEIELAESSFYQELIRDYLSTVSLSDPATIKIAPHSAELLLFLLNHLTDSTYETLRYEREVFSFLQQTEDCREGIQALIEEREPAFQGK